MQIIPSPENLQIEAIRHDAFGQLINFRRLLRLAAPLTEDDVGHDVEAGGGVGARLKYGSFGADEAGFFGVLEVVPMTLCNLAIDCLFDPSDLVDQAVAVVLHHGNGEAVLGIDDPYK